MREAIDTETLRAAFVQAQAQIMNNGEYTPVVVIDKGMALELLDEIDRQQRWIEEAAPLLDAWNALARESFAALGEPARLLGVWGVDVVRALIDSLAPVEKSDG